MTESLSEGAAGDKDRQHVKKFSESQPQSQSSQLMETDTKQTDQLKVRFPSPLEFKGKNHGQISFDWSLPRLFVFWVMGRLLADVPPLVTNG